MAWRWVWTRNRLPNFWIKVNKMVFQKKRGVYLIFWSYFHSAWEEGFCFPGVAPGWGQTSGVMTRELQDKDVVVMRLLRGMLLLCPSVTGSPGRCSWNININDMKDIKTFNLRYLKTLELQLKTLNAHRCRTVSGILLLLKQSPDSRNGFQSLLRLSCHRLGHFQSRWRGELRNQKIK